MLALFSFVLSAVFVCFVSGTAFAFHRYLEKGRLNPAKSSRPILVLEMAILFLSVYFRLFLAILSPDGDSVYFMSIIHSLLEEPFAGLYARSGITYPPLFNYTFYLLGRLMQLLGIPIHWSYRSFILFIKLPGICCEFLMAALISRMAITSSGTDSSGDQKPFPGIGSRVIALAMILLNPGYIFITSYISQVDAIYSLFMMLTLCLILERRLKTAYFSFAAAILFKFQAVFITPVLIFAIIQQVFWENFSWKRFFSHLCAGLSAIACMGISYLPFVYDFKKQAFCEGGMFLNFTSSLESYGYASHNAYNFWTLIGYNFKYSSSKLGPLTCDTWNLIFILLLVAFSSALFAAARKERDILPLLAALLTSGTFCFAVKMMSRYLYPTVILLILGYAVRPTLRRLICALSFSVVFFLGTFFTYRIYPPKKYLEGYAMSRLISLLLLLSFGFLIRTIWCERNGNRH